jgi:hypothetical protein
MFRRTILPWISIVTLLSGCSTIDSRISGRTATEQYLVTESIDRAIDGIRWEKLEGQRVYCEYVGLQAPEGDYFLASLEETLLNHGVHPVRSMEGADVRLVALVHSLGTDIWVGNFGIPLFLGAAATGVPSTLSGISLYTSNLQEGYCRVEFFGRQPGTNNLLWQSKPVYGTSYFKTQTFLGLFGPYKSGDIFPERKMFRPSGFGEIEEER